MDYIAKLKEEDKQLFNQQYESKRKSLGLAYALRLFGFHHLYLGNVGKRLLFVISWITVIIGFIRWIYDLLTMHIKVHNYNHQIKRDIFIMLK